MARDDGVLHAKHLQRERDLLRLVLHRVAALRLLRSSVSEQVHPHQAELRLQAFHDLVPPVHRCGPTVKEHDWCTAGGSVFTDLKVTTGQPKDATDVRLRGFRLVVHGDSVGDKQRRERGDDDEGDLPSGPHPGGRRRPNICAALSRVSPMDRRRASFTMHAGRRLSSGGFRWPRVEQQGRIAATDLCLHRLRPCRAEPMVFIFSSRSGPIHD